VSGQDGSPQRHGDTEKTFELGLVGQERAPRLPFVLILRSQRLQRPRREPSDWACRLGVGVSSSRYLVKKPASRMHMRRMECLARAMRSTVALLGVSDSIGRSPLKTQGLHCDARGPVPSPTGMGKAQDGVLSWRYSLNHSCLSSGSDLRNIMYAVLTSLTFSWSCGHSIFRFSIYVIRSMLRCARSLFRRTQYSGSHNGRASCHSSA